MYDRKHWCRVVAVATITLLAGATLALAQLQTGNLYGTVADNQGQPLPGVTVTLSGVGATQVQVTNAQGEFRFLSLAPGRWAVKAELEGFSTVDYPNITISVGRNTSIEITLTAAVEEVITVTSESPLLDERKISTGTTVTQTELEKIPTARDPWVILQQTPGVLVDRVNVGGNEGGQQSLYISPGTNEGNSQWAVDGVTITDMGAIGSSPTYYNFDSFEEMQVTTGGSDTSLSTGGVILNMVTKRGTNEWRFSGRYLLADDSWQSNLDFSQGDLGIGQGLGNAPICPAGVKPGTIIGGFACVGLGTDNRTFAQGNRIVDVKDFGIEGGGPIVRDKVWVWGSYGTQEVDLLTISDVSDFTELDSYAAKLNAQVTTNNSLTFFYHYGDKIKIGRNAGPTRPQPTTWNQDGPTDIWKVEDTHIFSSDFYLTGMASYVGGGFQLVPQGGGIGSGLATDNVTIDGAGVWGNSFLIYQTERPQEQAKVDGNYFFNTGSTSHELRFGVSLRNAQVDSFSTWPGTQSVGGPGFGAFGANTFVAWTRTDRNVTDDIDFTSVYVQDTLTFGNLTANLGLRYDLQEPHNNPTVVAPAPAAVNQGILVGGSFAGGDPGWEWESITPRLGLTYALGEDRSTLLRLSYSRFADQLGTEIASQTNVNFGYGFQVWYDNGDFVIDPSELGSFFSFSGAFDDDGDGDLDVRNTVASGFDPPITDELVASVEHALLPEFVIGASVTWRNYYDIVEFERQVDDGSGIVRPHRRSDYEVGFTHTGTLPDGSTFSVPQYTFRTRANGQFFFLDDGENNFGTQMENGDRERDYLGISLTFNKRLANRWLLRGHVTWQDWEWSVPDSENEDPTHSLPGTFDGDSVLLGSGVGSGAKGGIYINSNWSLDVSGLYQIAPDRPWGFNVAANINGREGYPVPYVSRGNLSDGLGTRSVLAGENDEFRNDDVIIVNGRVEKELTFGDWGLTLSVDAFNLLNESYVLQREVRLPACGGRPQAVLAGGPTFGALGGPCLTAGTGLNRGDFVNEVVSPRIFRVGARLNFR